MLNKPTDAAAPVIGRSGWDVLVQYKFSFLALAAITFYFFMDVMFPEKLADWMDSLYSFIDSVKPYILPGLFGAIAGRFVYKNYVYQPIILSVPDATQGDAEYKLSYTYFNRLIKKNGCCNPIATKTGRIKYVCRSYDPEEHTIDFGWIHSASVAPDQVFASRESYNALLEDYADKSRRVVQLENMPMLEGTKIGLSVVRKNNEIMSGVLGISDPVVTVDPDKALQELEDGVKDE